MTNDSVLFKNFRRDWGTTLLGVAFLVAAGIKLLFSVDQVLDIGLADEARYMYQGIFMLRDGFPSPQWAPLYAPWYYLITKIFAAQSRISQYYLSFALLSVLLPLVFFLYLRRLQVQPVIALLTAVLVLVSYSNLGVWPYPTKFSALVFFAALLASTLARGRLRFTLLLIGLLATTYVRPEYFLAFVVASAVLLILVVVNGRRQGANYYRVVLPHVAAVVVCLLGLWVLLGNPMEGNRQMVAFKQHFALNYVHWNGLTTNPWNNADALSREAFGAFSSLPQAIVNNPAAFLRHLASNAGSTIKVLAVAAAAPHLPVWLIPNSTLTALTAILGVALAMSFSFASWILIARARSVASTSGQPAYRQLFRDLGGADRSDVQVLLLALLAVGATILASAILIYPREHYFQIFAMLLLAAWAVVVTRALDNLRDRRLSNSQHIMVFAAVGALLFVLTPNLARGWLPGSEPWRARTDIRNTVEMLQRFDTGHQARYLTHAGWNNSFNVYLADNFVKVPAFPKSAPFEQMIHDQIFDIIIWPERIVQDQSYAQDDAYLSFLANPAAHGFTRLLVPMSGGRASLLVREDSSLFDLAQVREMAALALPGEALATLPPSAIPQAQLAARMREAEQLAQSGQINEAIAVYQLLIGLAPADRNLQMQYAAVLIDAGQILEALAAYEAINTQWPDFPWAYVRRAELLMEIDAINAAVPLYETAVKVAPDDPNVHFLMGRIYHRIGEREKAIAEMEIGLKLDPANDAARKFLQMLRAEGY